MRKKRGVLNVIGSLSSYIITMIFTFITQSFIVKILGIEYNGINGLFTNILTMLSVAELGLGTTIIFKLYDPIANNDKEKIKSWMNFYKICYRVVAAVVLLFGLIIIPFVPIIVGETLIKENIIVLYLIALSDTVLSYIMTYKRSLLYADQRNYIINFIHIGYIVLMNTCQIVLLYLTKNYILYLLIKLVYRLLENVIINIFVNKEYPYILENSKKIDKNEKKDFSKRIKAIFIQKVSFVINKGIDNVLISLFLGIESVGYYTNYNLIVTCICGIIFQTISGLTATIGNILTEKNDEKSYIMYRRINFINFIFTGICIVGTANCIQSFIKIWLGEQYLLNSFVIIAFLIYMYSDSIRRAITIFKEAAGICKEDKYMYIYMALINLFTSIILCKFIGISGVILGTAISYLFLIIYSYPKYIFKNVFNKKIKDYYLLNFKYLFIIIISLFITNISLYFLPTFGNLIDFVIKGIISLLIFIIIVRITNKNTEEFKYFVKFIKNFFKKKKNDI